MVFLVVEDVCAAGSHIYSWRIPNSLFLFSLVLSDFPNFLEEHIL